MTATQPVVTLTLGCELGSEIFKMRFNDADSAFGMESCLAWLPAMLAGLKAEPNKSSLGVVPAPKSKASFCAQIFSPRSRAVVQAILNIRIQNLPFGLGRKYRKQNMFQPFSLCQALC